MKLWEIEAFLQEHIQNFSKPKIKLEQYITTPHLASHTLYTAQNSFDDIEDKEVLDLGIGTGRFGFFREFIMNHMMVRAKTHVD